MEVLSPSDSQLTSNTNPSVSTTALYSRLATYASDASSVTSSPKPQYVTIELQEASSIDRDQQQQQQQQQRQPIASTMNGHVQSDHRAVSIPQIENGYSASSNSQSASPDPLPLQTTNGHPSAADKSLSPPLSSNHPNTHLNGVTKQQNKQSSDSSPNQFQAPELTMAIAAERVGGAVKSYFKRFLGTKAGAFPARPSAVHLCGSWVAAFIGIGIIAYMHYESGPSEHEALLGSFGAVSILTYGSFDSPFAQPRNVLVSHILASIIGVAFNNIVPQKWLSCALSVATALTAMQVTRTVHPPAGATAVLATLLSKTSFMFVLYPVLLGTVILVGVALVVNNFHKQYPLYWLRPKRSAPVSTIPTIVSAPHHHNDSILCAPFSSLLPHHHHFSNKEHQINTFACFQSANDFAVAHIPPSQSRAASPIPFALHINGGQVIALDDGTQGPPPQGSVEDESGSELEVDVEDQFQSYAEPVDTETFSLESPQNRVQN